MLEEGHVRNLFIEDNKLLMGTRDGNINIYDTEQLINK
jgi:hypothetical protein